MPESVVNTLTENDEETDTADECGRHEFLNIYTYCSGPGITMPP